jgi:hypothetical protein
MDLERNLSSLSAEFYSKGKPARGRKVVWDLIHRKKDKALAHLLRDHTEESVYGDELIKRFEFDALIEFYNLLLVGVFSGYIPPQLNEELLNEIDTMLRHRSVRPYYNAYYKYKLTDYTLRYFTKHAKGREMKFESHLNTFNVFITLNRMLKNDKDIERFLGMLDHVSYGDHALDDVIDTLSNSLKLSKIISGKKTSNEAKAVWGFFKYTSFLSQFRELLESRDDSPLLQSAMWYYHGYYFDRMNTTMRSMFKKAFKNIAAAVSDPVTFRNMAEELYGQKTDFDDIKIDDIRRIAEAIVEKSQGDVAFILDKKWKSPMTDFFVD